MKKILFASIFLFIFSSFMATPASAKVIMQEQGIVEIKEGEVIDDDLFVLSENVDIRGQVLGDVYAFANKVMVSGDIKGVLVTGAAEVILENAKVAGSTMIGSASVTLDSSTDIAGSLIVAGADIKNSSSVTRNLMLAAGSIYQNGSVGKEARLGAGTIELGPKNKIKGDLTYALGEENAELTASSDSSVSGTTSRFKEGDKFRQNMAQARQDFAMHGRSMLKGWMIFAFFSSLLIGSLFIYLFPSLMLTLTQQVTANPLRYLLHGLVITILILPITLALMFTVIGIPLAMLLFVLYYIAVHVAKLVVAYALGWFGFALANINKPNRYLVFFMGLLAFYLLKMIPGIGWLVSVVFTWTGLGVIYHQIFSSRKSS